MPYVGPAPTPNAPKDLQGGELILDADNDTTITADTDDQIDIKIAGSDEIKITAAMIAPATADGSALGGTSNEWSDLYLADSGVIYFGADQDINITHVADTGLTTNGDFSVGDDLKLTSDAAVLGFGADNDVTLTHVADTGVLLNSTMAIQFNDASQYINAPSNAILDINATDEIELNATLVDINANVEISGTATTTGVHTFTAVPVFPNNTVETADIQDNAITLAKMAGGTDGNIISYDASGDPVAIATGSDGQVLTSTGAGSPPAFEDAAGGPTQANQAALEAQTNEDTYAPPDLMHHHPGMVKAWCKWDIAVSVNASHNVSSVTDSATGLWTINWNTDFSSVNYAVACSWRDDNDKVEFQCSGGTSAAGTYEFKLVNGGGSFVDANADDDMHVIAVGDH